MRGVILAVLATACGGDIFVGNDPGDGDYVPPELEVVPAQLNYGGRDRDEVVWADVTLKNVGGSVLDIDALTLDGPGDFTLDLAGVGLPLELGAGQQAVVRVGFQPAQPGVREGSLLVTPTRTSGDPVTVPLAGLGEIGALEVDPFPVDFGNRPLGCFGRVDVDLRNVGYDVLTLSSVTPPADVVLTGLPAFPAELEVGMQVPLKATVYFDTLGPFAQEIAVVHDGGAGPSAVPVVATVVPRPPVVETFPVPETGPVDVIYVVDQSGSMFGQIDLVVEQTLAFSEHFPEERLDARFAVLTGTEPSCFTDVLDPTDEDWDTRLRAALVSLPTIGRTVDGNAFLTEAPLESVARAVAYTGPGGCNDGFRRPLAPLHVVAFSDEADQSSGFLTGGPTYWEPHYATVDAWAGPGRLVWHAIVDVGSACGDEPFGVAGHADAVRESGGVMLDVCEGNWIARVSDLTDRIAEGARTFYLAWQDVVSSSVEVDVDGVPLVGGWTYQPAPARVVMDELAPGGSVVTVRYQRASDCPP